MLPTEKISNIGICIKPMSDVEVGDIKYFVSNMLMSLGYWQPQHLYITSEDEIKEGEYGYDPIINKVFKIKSLIGLPNKVYKIIATTDKSLKYTNHRISPVPNFCNLPQPSKGFIEKYCKVGGIDEVMVEYEYAEVSAKFKNAQIKGDWSKYLPENAEFNLKINSHNEITIHPIKERMYSRKELLDFVSPLIGKLESEFGDPTKEGIEIAKEKWIKGNL